MYTHKTNKLEHPLKEQKQWDSEGVERTLTNALCHESQVIFDEKVQHLSLNITGWAELSLQESNWP